MIAILQELNALGLIIACLSGLVLLVINIFLAIDKLPK
jgi:hypothetical protein